MTTNNEVLRKALDSLKTCVSLVNEDAHGSDMDRGYAAIRTLDAALSASEAQPAGMTDAEIQDCWNGLGYKTKWSAYMLQFGRAIERRVAQVQPVTIYKGNGKFPDGYCTDPNGVICAPAGKYGDFSFGYDMGYIDGLQLRKKVLQTKYSANLLAGSDPVARGAGGYLAIRTEAIGRRDKYGQTVGYVSDRDQEHDLSYWVHQIMSESPASKPDTGKEEADSAPIGEQIACSSCGLTMQESRMLAASKAMAADTAPVQALPPLPDPIYIYHDFDGSDDLFEFSESGAVDDGCEFCTRLYTKGQMLEYAGAALSSAAQGEQDKPRSIEITLRQAEALVELFGGHDCQVTITEPLPEWADVESGLFAYCTEYPDEGTAYLGKTEVDDDLANHGRKPATQPTITQLSDALGMVERATESGRPEAGMAEAFKYLAALSRPNAVEQGEREVPKKLLELGRMLNLMVKAMHDAAEKSENLPEANSATLDYATMARMCGLCNGAEKELASRQAVPSDKAYRECLSEIQKYIKQGKLPGNGCDETAQRNGLILAANLITRMIAAHKPDSEGSDTGGEGGS